MPSCRHVPRGRGYDKRSVARHMRQLEAWDGTVEQYARKHQLEANPLVVVCEDGFPKRWQEYVAENGAPPETTCPYCEKTFVANNANQRFCSRRCSEHARTDERYFGGKRRETIGLAEGTCQLCGAKPKRGLQSHHVVGKENDPGNEWLIGLCAGCHELVTIASRRLFLREDEGWDRLISLVNLRVAGILDGSMELW